MSGAVLLPIDGFVDELPALGTGLLGKVGPEADEPGAVLVVYSNIDPPLMFGSVSLESFTVASDVPTGFLRQMLGFSLEIAECMDVEPVKLTGRPTRRTRCGADWRAFSSSVWSADARGRILL
ncbi:MAG: hypothetical protein ACREQN_03700 [Candidatus Binataceae bacterium]